MILSQNIRIASVQILAMVCTCSLSIGADEPVSAATSTNTPPRSVEAIHAEYRVVAGAMARIKHAIQLEINKAERMHPNIKALKKKRAKVEEELAEAALQVPGVIELDGEIKKLQAEREQLKGEQDAERMRDLSRGIQQKQGVRKNLVAEARTSDPEVDKLYRDMENLDQRIQIALEVLPRLRELQVELDGWEHQQAQLQKEFWGRTKRGMPPGTGGGASATPTK